MTHVYEKPFNVYERLGLIRMSAAKRREAIARMRRAEAIADLTLSRARLVLAKFKKSAKAS